MFCFVFSLFGPVNDDSLSIAFRELYPIGAAAILQGKQWTANELCRVCQDTEDRNAVQNVWQGHGLLQTVIIFISLLCTCVWNRNQSKYFQTS